MMLFNLFAFFIFIIVAVVTVVSTIGFSPAAFLTLGSSPGQFLRLIRSKRLRRNHALEHATINIIEERHGRTRLAGLAEADGFLLRGGASPHMVASAAQEALARLRAGERRLAIHPRSPTSLVAALLIIGLLLLLARIVIGQPGWLILGLGVLAAILLAPRLSLLLQRWVTTTAGMDDITISGVESREPVGRFGLITLVFLNPVFVRIEDRGAPEDAGRIDGRHVTIITGEGDEVSAGGYRVR